MENSNKADKMQPLLNSVSAGVLGISGMCFVLSITD